MEALINHRRVSVRRGTCLVDGYRDFGVLELLELRDVKVGDTDAPEALR